MKGTPSQIPSLRARGDDPLVYAFNGTGQLDPGTKLLDIGLDGYTPVAALKKLVNDPRHMSVALHEVTHFVSLQNTLGALMGFLAMRANSVGGGLLQLSETGGKVYPEFIACYCNLHRQYRLLIEAWRPLLEGLAVYAQTHCPDEAGDPLIVPLSLLWNWKLQIAALRVPASTRRIHPDELDDGFLAAGYQAIRKGPGLWHSGRPLAACIELLDPERLRPYFLGHAYLRALQRCFARASAEYESAERFFNIVLRILRSSTRRLLAGSPQWDQLAGAERLYNWIEIVRQAGPARIVALRTLDDNVDVLHFLEKGEVTTGYSHTDVENVRDLRELIPSQWDEFAKNLHARHSSLGHSEEELAGRMATHWLRGTVSLNLSMRGLALVAGWIPDGYRAKHALALKVDDELWWVAVNDDEMARLGVVPGELSRLHPQAMRSGNGRALAGTSCPLLIDCFAHYTPWAPGSEAGNNAPKMFPKLNFNLHPSEPKGDSVLMCVAPFEPAIAPCHLQSVADDSDRVWHRTVLEMRRIISKAMSPRGLSIKFKRRGNEAIAALLDICASGADLAVSRVEAHVNRRILKGLLGRFPTPEDLSLLSRGVGMFPEAEGLEALIVTAYSVKALPDEAAGDRIRMLNERSREAIGKSLFTWDTAKRRVSYCGLWGDTLGS
jgi:hypothetical protein